jgi:hypothetical protein
VSTPATPQAPSDTPVTAAPAPGRTATTSGTVGSTPRSADRAAAGAPPDAGRSTPPIERSAADRAMRSLLRIEGDPERGAILGAQRAMTSSILVSAVRCVITYLLVPILTPIVGVLDLVAAPLSLALCTLAFVMSTRSMRRFWRADHSKRWHYTALVAVVWAFLITAVIRDIGQLL